MADSGRKMSGKGGIKPGENWDDVPKYSVILSGPRAEGGAYKREDIW